MRFTSTAFSIDSKEKVLLIFKDTPFPEVYRRAVKLWCNHTSFCALPFPEYMLAQGPIYGKMFKAGEVYRW